jgi:hypothetical protein
MGMAGVGVGIGLANSVMAQQRTDRQQYGLVGCQVRRSLMQVAK